MRTLVPTTSTPRRQRRERRLSTKPAVPAASNEAANSERAAGDSPGTAGGEGGPLMVRIARGTILVTSATAAVRGNGGQHSHAAGMGGRRMLCQTLNAEFAPKGIHVAHIIIDGAVDAPDTLGKMLGPERFHQLRESRGMENDGLLLPSKIADTYFHLSQQHRSVWTHEIDMRSFSDRPWWNH